MEGSDDRRKAARCPVCQGPAVAGGEAPGVIRCRNSLCVQNHPGQACPRCGSNEIGDVRRKQSGAGFDYTCSDCNHTW